MSELAGKTCVVFGGAGFIGWNLCQRLLREGAAVKVVFRKELSDLQRLDSRIEWVRGNILDRSFVLQAVSGQEIVYNLASTSSPGQYNFNPSADVFGNVAPALQLAEVAASAGVKRFVFASSGGTVYGVGGVRPLRESSATEPISAYGAGKLAAEKYLEICSRHLGLDCVSLRVANPYGPYQSAGRGQGLVAKLLSCAALQEKVVVWGDGRIIRDYIHVDDVVAAFIAVAANRTSERVFNVGTGRGTSVNELISLVESASNCQIVVEYMTGRASDVPVNVLDCSLLSETLRWRPSIKLEDGIADTWNWYTSVYRRGEK